MPDSDNIQSETTESEQYPIEPRYHPVNTTARKLYDFCASAKLAMFLLVAILVCCLLGVTVFRDQKANAAIFDTLWFNSLLIALVVNVACCFFGRIWGRKLTAISFGMILFHLSFVALFAGIVYNSLFYFRGVIRLTEGETLLNRDPNSYDLKERGRYFRYSRMKGSTTLNKLIVGYTVDGKDKRLAYDVSIGEEGARSNGIIYITNHYQYNGVKYFRDKEGFSALTVLYDSAGRELYGAYIPLQTLKQKDDSFLVTSGTKEGAGSFLFPKEPDEPRVDLLLSYRAEPKNELAGEAFFQVKPYRKPETGGARTDEKAVSGKAAIGAKFTAGEYALSVNEIRYWVGMRVSYEPGQPLILGSLWVGLFGVILTTLARIVRQGKVRRADTA